MCCNCRGSNRSICPCCGCRKKNRVCGSCCVTRCPTSRVRSSRRCRAMSCSTSRVQLLKHCRAMNCSMSRVRSSRHCRARKSSKSPLPNPTMRCPAKRNCLCGRCCSTRNRGMRRRHSAKRSGYGRICCSNWNWDGKSSWDCRGTSGRASRDSPSRDTNNPIRAPNPSSSPS